MLITLFFASFFIADNIASCSHEAAKRQKTGPTNAIVQEMAKMREAKLKLLEEVKKKQEERAMAKEERARQREQRAEQTMELLKKLVEKLINK